jgi:hypothetical protein
MTRAKLNLLEKIVLICLALAFTGASSAFAYIPKSETIVGRVARSHGKGAYVVEQELQFRTSTEPFVLRERWIVETGDTMRLSVFSPQGTKTSEPVRYEAVYHGAKRTVTDLDGGIKSLPLSPEFIETFFHARTGKGFLHALVQSRIVPASILHDHVRPQKLEQIKNTPDPLVRLGRSSGVVTWIFGEPSPAEGKTNPEAWIEQDAFNVRRLRFPSEAEVAADRFSTYPNALKFPRERTVSWGTNSVTIRVVSIRQIGPAQIGKLLDPSSFSLSKEKPARLPDLAQVREFYTRFR